MGDADTGLMWALKTGDMDEVTCKVLTCEDANRVLEGGRMPLHYAADFGQVDVIEYLVSKGADVNAQDKHGLTPLIAACFENHALCVKLLLEKGACKEQPGPNGIKALEAAENLAIKDMLK